MKNEKETVQSIKIHNRREGVNHELSHIPLGLLIAL